MVRGSDGEQSDGGDTAQFWFVVMRRITRPADVSCNLRVRISSYGTLSLCLLLVADCGVDSLMTQRPVGLFEFFVLAPGSSFVWSAALSSYWTVRR